MKIYLNLDHFEELDTTRRELIIETEQLKSKRNEVTQQVAELKREKKDADHLLRKCVKLAMKLKI